MQHCQYLRPRRLRYYQPAVECQEHSVNSHKIPLAAVLQCGMRSAEVQNLFPDVQAAAYHVNDLLVVLVRFCYFGLNTQIAELGNWKCRLSERNIHIIIQLGKLHYGPFIYYV